MQNIYIDTAVSEYHASQLDVKNINGKISFHHVPYPYDKLFEQQINTAVNEYDKVVIFCSELHDHTVEALEKLSLHKNLKIFCCGFINDVDHGLWMDWFTQSTDFYQRHSVLNNLKFGKKEKYFDVLLGRVKPHRSLIFKNIDQEKNIVSYMINKNIDSDWIWERTGVKIIDNPTWTIDCVNYYGESLSLSKIVPIDIYNKTAYSLVAETNYSNHYSFYTEKIVKPILGQRLFLVSSGKHYLKNLRSLGFQTFGNTIDESYDDIDDLEKRNQTILEQINYLINQDQESIFDQVLPTVKHNYKILIETDWYGNFQRELRSFLES